MNSFPLIKLMLCIIGAASLSGCITPETKRVNLVGGEALVYQEIHELVIDYSSQAEPVSKAMLQEAVRQFNLRSAQFHIKHSNKTKQQAERFKALLIKERVAVNHIQISQNNQLGSTLAIDVHQWRARGQQCAPYSLSANALYLNCAVRTNQVSQAVAPDNLIRRYSSYE